ncbi:hypothetical protein K2173_020916 [Erythroxylum novogranatense]|uniref:Leucine-rich repeat-containing N-terminal plant-type domain-containing protein n=1 Tax=Erythroxylum novogranatense TaxID=1862640 RepID=A0AAV8TM65_9ROSI|nr:hypothetical protein K2173_020916 [Erythroxylum novogranatense]
MWLTNKYWYWGVVVIVLLANITSQGLLCYGCSSHERIALLQLKSHFPQSPTGWIGADCCTWYGVICNPLTSRVSELSINNTYDDHFTVIIRGSNVWEGYYEGRNWHLNASLFLPFHELTSLDLSNNFIAGCVENGGFETLVTLENLESLRLTSNSFNNSILSSVGVLSLKNLDLRYNAINGSINMTELNPLNHLEELYLGGNKIIQFESSKVTKGFSNLSALYLDGLVNKVTDELLESLGEFHNLKNLSLDGNDLRGAMFRHQRYSLIELSLHDSYLDENFLQSLELLPSLKVLDIQGLQPTSQGFPRLNNLERLDLSGNALNNKIVLSIGNLTSLQYLNLANCGLSGHISQELNALNHLEELDLSGNEIIKFESSKGTKGFSNLITLYLDHLLNNVTDEFLESLGEFHNLMNLSLSGNNLRGAMFRHQRYNLVKLSLDKCSLDEKFLQSLGLLPSLKVLDISYIQTGLQTSQGFAHLNNLEQLDLSNSPLNYKNMQSIGNLTSLQYLNLADCGLSGHIAQSLCALKDLQELDMSDNYLIGTLPYCMENLTSLQQLHLSRNNLSGDIYFSPLKSLISLERLYLWNNHFQIPLSFSPFFNHSKLISFQASKNEVYSRGEMYNLIPKFQLQSLSLSCYGNGESIPQFLYHQHDLEDVYISHVRMKGTFPHWLLQNNTNLMLLYLKNTSLSGILESPIQSHVNLQRLDISDNKLSGHIPLEIGACFPRLRSLNMSSNNFSGSIPSSLGNMNILKSLDLSSNGLSGKLPDLLIKGCQQLYLLKLSNNKLQGQMFLRNASLSRLIVWLQLDGNQFIGSIPNSLSESSSLVALDVSHNNLSGGIPQWITNMTVLQVLDLSHNKFDGILLLNLFPSSISQVYLSNNRLQGSLLNDFDCENMVAIDLSHNNLVVGIPKWLGRCSKLRYFVLKGNNFEGKIPSQLCKLDRLSLIDLSSNHLYGRIPSCLRVSVHGDISDQVEFGGTYISPNVPDSKPIRLDFTTKSVSYTYVGKILAYLSGLDLSSNAFIGDIPSEIGNLSLNPGLNLSCNNLVGSIPPTFSNLQKVESLDLSHNKLEGNIPSQLTQLYCLSVFSVAYNNLSGRTPDRVAQFATFENSSYEGNPFLCGSPLSRSCDATPTSNNSRNLEGKDEDGFIDMNVFWISFGVSFIMMLMGIIAVLCINLYWRRTWFYFVGKIMNNCFYFLVDNIPMLSKYRFYQPFA